ncbi:MAG: hypothetical protein EZS28_016191 [Streblomastix strix]|uniref:Uncharacterized protein n=1 Tax=Streblomastix strix TaxID=222440 RepID=A0A5J4W027_9EUKA|nr:MAG: hypothetical protein EZS28_016191 [Streblomastix strix]
MELIFPELFIFHHEEGILKVGFDGDNDKEMLQQVGFSYAPANARSEAREAAKVVLPWSNNQNCVAKMIKMVFFGESADQEDGKSEMEGS